ncbi:hypothetical protein Q8A67_021919 [Cirrhinus molitorella]|uniref:Chromo domain-containing protein n=1 Tax=Cirrhinus molitorella TaxID=172907 RepID=A0AA88TEW5_9TELE|nr:hypothetical protein Q8A67_021919 [Cirrhinus molitorella]
MWAEYAQNSLVKPATGLTPFKCILGYQPPLFPWSGEPSDLPSVTAWLQRSEETWDRAHTHLLHAVRYQTHQANQHRRAGPSLAPGQWVWLSTKDLRLRLPCRKLSPRYVGPFKIIKQITPVSFRLELPANYRISPTFHMSLLKPAGGPRGDPEEGDLPQPPPIMIDGEEAYQVHELLDSRRRGGTLQYLVDWEGYGPEERSWVNAGDILDPTLTDEFHRAHPGRPAPRPRGRPRRRVPPRVRSRSQGGGSVTTEASARSPLHHQREPSPEVLGMGTFLPRFRAASINVRMQVQLDVETRNLAEQEIIKKSFSNFLSACSTFARIRLKLEAMDRPQLSLYRTQGWSVSSRLLKMQDGCGSVQVSPFVMNSLYILAHTPASNRLLGLNQGWHGEHNRQQCVTEQPPLNTSTDTTLHKHWRRESTDGTTKTHLIASFVFPWFTIQRIWDRSPVSGTGRQQCVTEQPPLNTSTDTTLHKHWRRESTDGTTKTHLIASFVFSRFIVNKSGAQFFALLVV